jgi:hypothetical protein
MTLVEPTGVSPQRYRDGAGRPDTLASAPVAPGP